MEEQEQQPQNEVQVEQQDINQVEPTPLSPPPSHKKLIVGIVAVFVLVVAGIVGAYFFLTSENSIVPMAEQQNQPENIVKSEIFLEAKKLLTLPEGNKGGSINISEDLQHFLLSTTIDGKKFLYADNALIIEGPFGNSSFTSDNKLVYTLYQEDGQYVVVNGEKIGGPYDNVRGPSSMPDGRILYGAQRGEQGYFIVGDKEYGPYFSVEDPDPIISPDGKYVSFDIIDEFVDYQYPVARYVINGKEESETYFSVSRGVYSPDSKHFAYFATQADTENDTIAGYSVLDGDKIGPYDDIRVRPLFSPDSSKLAFIAKKDKDWFVVLNGKEGKYHSAMPRLLTFSPDSSKFAYVAIKDKDSLIYINGEVAVTITNGVVGELTFSRDSQKFAYSILQKKGGDSVLISTDGTHSLYTIDPVTEKKAFVILNGEKREIYDHVWDLRFSPDGEQFAYSAQDNYQQFIVFNGEEKERHTIERGAGSIHVTFSPDSKHYMYVARTDNGKLIVLDGKAIEGSYDLIYRTKFSPDSKYLLYIYGLNDEIWYMPYKIES